MMTLPVGEIADFGGACDSKNVWDHVPIETVERIFLIKLNHYYKKTLFDSLFPSPHFKEVARVAKEDWKCEMLSDRISDLIRQTGNRLVT